MAITRRTLLGAIPGSLVLTACGGSRRPPQQIRVIVSPRVNMASIHLAYEKGLFKEEGLDVQLEERQTQVQILPPLVAGQADVVLTGFSTGLCNAILRGSNIRIVAARDELKPGCSNQSALYYRSARYPQGPEASNDWKGSRIALQGETQMLEFYLDQLLAAKGVAPSSVEIARMGVEEAVAASSTGHLDMFFGSGRPEFLAGGLPKDVKRSDMVVDLLGEFQYGYVLFGSKMLEGDPEVGAAFLRAYLRGVRRFVAGETPKFLDDLASRLHMNPDLAKAECRLNVSTTGEVRMRDLNRWLAWAVEKKTIPSSFTADQIVDSRFQVAAAKALR